MSLQTAPGPAGDSDEADDMKRVQEQRGSKSLRLSALFSAMMESNAMLREDIEQMEGRDPDLLTESETARENEPQPRQLHSQSLPARLLDSSAHTPRAHTNRGPAARRREGEGSLDSYSSDSDSMTGVESEETEGDDVEQNLTNLSSAPHHNRLSGGLGSTEEPLPLSITSVSSTELSDSTSESDYGESENDPFASPGESTIEAMWDNFSVEEYAPPLKLNGRSEFKDRRGQHVVRYVWKRRVTIPEPFVMTIRDEARPRRRKSRALITAEREKLEREMQEELECQRKFRALPVPATTYVPIDEIRRRDQDQGAQLGCERVTQPIKPFDFMKREEDRQQQKQRDIARSESDEQRVVFRAKPAPQAILSPRVSEELKEKEEYRRILIKVRSQEMLARAQLPKSMQEKQRSESVKKERLGQKQREAFVTEEHTFRPRVKPAVPNHDQLYCQFQQQLAAKRELKLATTPKPFVLQTSAPSRCVQPHKPSTLDSSSLISTTTSATKSSTCESLAFERTRHSRSHVAMDNVKLSRSQPTPVTGTVNRRHRQCSIPMTETAKLRQSISERKLAEAAEKVAAEVEERRQKREQQRELQSRVAKQVQSHDHFLWVQEKQREHLKQLRCVQYTSLGS